MLRRLALPAGPLLAFALYFLADAQGSSHALAVTLGMTGWCALWWVLEPVRAPVTAPGRENWKDVVPHTPGRLILSAMAVVEFTHQNRQLTIQQDKLLQQRDALEMEWRNLLVEQRALSEHSRVEELAQQQLQMVRPTGQQDIVVDEP